jgi:hypothetical protein
MVHSSFRAVVSLGDEFNTRCAEVFYDEDILRACRWSSGHFREWMIPNIGFIQYKNPAIARAKRAKPVRMHLKSRVNPANSIS